MFGGDVAGVTKAEALGTLEVAARAILPAGYTVDFAGESRRDPPGGHDALRHPRLCDAADLLVLVAQFGSFRDPLGRAAWLRAARPLRGAGVHFPRFTTINIYSQIGLLTLVGLIAKNGILMVAFANELQIRGYAKAAAIREASGRTCAPS